MCRPYFREEDLRRFGGECEEGLCTASNYMPPGNDNPPITTDDRESCASRFHLIGERVEYLEIYVSGGNFCID